MPVYEFCCQQCGETFEKNVNDRTEIVCPSCHSPDVERAVSRLGSDEESEDAGFESYDDDVVDEEADIRPDPRRSHRDWDDD